MALTDATITLDVTDWLDVPYDARQTMVLVTTNATDDTIVDTAANKIRIGPGRVTLNADGTGSFQTWVPSSGPSQPSTWQIYVHIYYPDRGTGGQAVKTKGPYTITGSGDLADLITETAVDPALSTDNAITTLANDTTSQFRAALNSIIGSAGFGLGTVTQVAGQSPDGSGHVALSATDVGALPSAPNGVTQVSVTWLSSYGTAIPPGTPPSLVAEPAVAAGPQLVGAPSTGSATGTTNLTITRSTGAGARLVLFVNLAAATAVTDSAGNTWTRLETTATYGATTNRIIEVWECVGANAISNLTVTKASAAQAVLYEITGGSGSALHAGASTTTGTVTTSIPLSVSANALIIGAVAHGTSTGVTATISSPFTDLITEAVLNTTEMKSASYQPTAGGSYGPVWTLSASSTKAVVDYAVNP